MLYTSTSRVASLARITLFPISIAAKMLYQTADISTTINVPSYANTSFISFLLLAVKLSSNRSCYANWIPVRWDANGVVHWSPADHLASDMPCREQPMRVLSNSHRFGLELNKLCIVWSAPRYAIVTGKHSAASFPHRLIVWQSQWENIAT